MRRILAAVTVAGLTTTGAGALALAPAHAATADCRADYQIVAQWPGGFQAQVALANLGDPITGWTLAFDFDTDTQRIGPGWNGSISQTGRHVETTSPAWSPTLATNETTTVDVNGTYVDVNPPPVNYTLNGVPCTADPSPSPSTTKTPDPITVTGVVRPGVESGCLLLVPDLSYPQPFLLLGGDREVLVPGARVRVVGVPENTHTWCQQGQPLRVLSAYPAST